ncbi:DUF2339 domain-containing protein [Pseudomonas sp. v388]|uniref:DUF2339 domain-containing protein n=1 Tax=Pseudomonas sp. v388 TaxID=2479849 RepID=UPI000F76AB72|nr:DUF2339 domain-containing protein [Pseudomonas sp. v388]RRV09337.1 DUF2339 domain-containing protein [Pseudomonas sp. v388]
MLWICLLLGGAVLGYSLSYDEWQGMLVGAACGWAVCASVRLYSLRKRSFEQAQQLETTRKTVESLQQRLTLLEFPPVSNFQPVEPAQAPAPLPADAVVVAAHTDGPELIWDLPDEQPLPAKTDESAWRPAPDTRDAAQANPFDSTITRARNWLLGGNTVLRVGVVLLFLGLAFLLRYATEGIVFPIEARYAAVAGCALGLLGLGWWLRHRNPQYALMVQGAGVGVLYLTVFAAMKLHPLLEPSMGFTLLVAITAFSTILAVTQNALALACAGALGGFAAPLLASTGQGSHVALFSYFALLNAGIFAIAWFKAWRVLNLIGFFGTFGIGFAWGINSYTPAMFWSTEPFLILFFLMYLAIGLMFARRKLQETGSASDDPAIQLRKGDYVDGTLLFGTPIVGFGLQYALVEHLQFGAAFSALALGAIYLGLGRLLALRAPGQAALLMETCLALGVVFATLAIPLGLGSQWTTCAWAVEGAAVFWLGMRQERLLARGFGLLLQIGAGAALLNQLDLSYSALLDHGDYWTPMVMAIAALISAWCIHRFNGLTRLDPKLATALLLTWGAAWWAFSLICSVLLFVPEVFQPTWLLIAAAVSVALWATVALRLQWPDLAVLCTALMPVASLLLIGSLRFDYHPAEHWGWLGWLAVIAVHLLTLRKLAPVLPRMAGGLAHILGCWLVIALLALELRMGLMQLSEQHNAWRWLGWALLPSLYLLAMAHPRSWPWPISAQPREYRVWAAAPMAVLMLAWFWLANIFSDGAAAPLPYVPLLNPLELGLLFALAGICLWMQRYLAQLGFSEAVAQRSAQLVVGASLFVLVTAMVMRTAHHWNDVPWDADHLLASMQVQAGLSIVWTLMALALMIGGHLRRRREMWIAGAALIAVVVAKLFFVELSDRGSMARIVSFIGVGMLLLVVGYFAPLPPKQSDREVRNEPDLPSAAEPRQP